ncbi:MULTISPECIES: pyridoxal phosphate-dependent aminotransferase [Janthinobacterium]|uniref:Aminotransferase class I/II-fold pyridoxal phosphate-dependent enzyme n=1 Tax=Janthinobacterium violaceinigrum TaxID=2654252 RepID=A0A6I1HRK3_9BURK|nr:MULTISPECIES: pyridoxal phosphate-dependent aminotransferase [Janthinobacterium]KAB8061314.1 aminotransferase class I/II-fold pyridoxal phosphate-dependent enzyme [Janthinobacterium violaceinigrum]MED5596036.1 pyridoxal phosphate-dependent aminotransferase [Janthinobacterium sp. P210006]
MNSPSLPHLTPTLTTRLPAVGTTVFTRMSSLAAQHGAVNLGQGFPDFGCDPALVELVSDAMRAGHNQYPMMTGAAPLRVAIAAKIARLYGHAYDAGTEITVTAGATQALTTAILCCVHPGDEVIVIEPAYDSYLPAIALAGGVPVLVSMQVGEQGYSVPWDKLAAAVSSKTRLIIINTPHNPTGTILRPADVAALADIVRGTQILILSDEVYEHMVYDGVPHASLSRNAELAARSFIVSSFGKTYHVTGWKVGYVAAPAALTAEFRKVHQYNVFTVNTPMQHGIAGYMADPQPYLDLPAFYQRKRDLFRDGLAGSRFTLLPADGTYFQCVRYDAISQETEAQFAEWLTTEIKVAAIPVSAFYAQGKESGIVRFCFAKQDDTLRLALERLRSI